MSRGEDCIDVVDFGDCNARLFDRALEMIDKKKFKTLHTDPCFYDGRGEDLAIGETIDHMREAPPEHCYLLGVIPWKLFEINYVPQERRPGFREELEKMAVKVHTVVGEAQKSGNAAAYVANWIRSRRPVADKASPAEESRIFDELYEETNMCQI
jgi:hypothetical protein